MTNKELLTEAVEILYGTDGYSATDLNRIFKAIDLIKQVQLPEEEITEHDPTKEEAEILEEFDDDFFDLLTQYQEKGVRGEVVRNAAISNAEIWSFDDV